MKHTLGHWENTAQVPAFANSECHVWRLAVDQFNSNMLGQLSACLSVEEVQRAEKYVFAKDRQRFIAVRAVLRQLLAAYLDLSPTDLTFAQNRYGKPFLESSPDSGATMYFNVSHSHDIALLAFSRSVDVGVDVEYIEREIEFRNLARRFFAPEENQAIAASGDGELAQQFFRLWTRKEAFVKAVGTGLSFSLSDFSISPNPATQPVLLHVDKTRYDGPCWLADIDLQSGYLAGIACLGEPADCKLYNWPLLNA